MSGSSNSGGDWRPTPVPVERTDEAADRQGGGAGAGGTGGGGSGRDPCAITEQTTLNSPNPAVVPTLRPGDVLTVTLNAGPPRRLVAVAPTGQVAGSVTSASMGQLLACIDAGRGYRAVVVAVRSGMVQVRIEPQ